MPKRNLHEVTFKMPLLNYLIRKHFRPKILILDFDDTVCLWPRNLKLKDGKHLNFNAYMSNVFAKITSEVLGIDFEEAAEMCMAGFSKYGSSIIELIESEDYDVSIEEIDRIFEDVHMRAATHPTKGLVGWAKPNFKLHYLLSQLSNKPYIFTHGSTAYAKIGLQAMGLLNTVIPEESVFGMEQYGYYNTKKGANAYIWLQQKVKVAFNRMIMSEDSHKNLIWAHNLGMKTVLLHGPDKKGEPFPDYDYVDHTHQTLEDYVEMFLKKGISYTETKCDRTVAEMVGENPTYGARVPYIEALLAVA